MLHSRRINAVLSCHYGSELVFVFVLQFLLFLSISIVTSIETFVYRSVISYEIMLLGDLFGVVLILLIRSLLFCRFKFKFPFLSFYLRIVYFIFIVYEIPVPLLTSNKVRFSSCKSFVG